MAQPLEPRRISSGVAGLDEVLKGGLPSAQMHLVCGRPGTGKTTLGLQFLLAGAGRGETGLYLTLAESAAALEQVAASHGWDLGGIVVRELAPTEEQLNRQQQYTILYPGEVEFTELVEAVVREVGAARPTLVVFDSLSELRLLARDEIRYRQQILALKQFFATQQCTVLLLDDADEDEPQLDSVVHGVITLEHSSPTYGPVRRQVQVVKLRGATFRSGRHDLEITTGGLVVYPRLVARDFRGGDPALRVLAYSGLPELDRLLGGGVTRGTSLLFIGPAGSGKSSLAARFVTAAAERGEQSAIYVFEELRQTLMDRCEGLGLPLGGAIEQGLVTVEQLDAGQLSPGAFVRHVQEAVEQRGARTIVIDSVNGFLNAMGEERLVLIQLHELLTYLGERGVLTILTVAQHGLLGDHTQSPLDVSYLADTVVLLRFFESAGEVRGAISVLKKRVGGHERSIREIAFGPGITVGGVLRDFEGVMSGTPRFMGSPSELMDRGDE